MAPALNQNLTISSCVETLGKVVILCLIQGFRLNLLWISDSLKRNKTCLQGFRENETQNRPFQLQRLARKLPVASLDNHILSKMRITKGLTKANNKGMDAQAGFLTSQHGTFIVSEFDRQRTGNPFFKIWHVIL